MLFALEAKQLLPPSKTLHGASRASIKSENESSAWPSSAPPCKQSKEDQTSFRETKKKRKQKERNRGKRKKDLKKEEKPRFIFRGKTARYSFGTSSR